MNSFGHETVIGRDDDPRGNVGQEADSCAEGEDERQDAHENDINVEVARKARAYTGDLSVAPVEKQRLIRPDGRVGGGPAAAGAPACSRCTSCSSC